jgi:murein DD-endopeptidase MepM/ murein hydrolase activator NlpD
VAVGLLLCFAATSAAQIPDLGPTPTPEPTARATPSPSATTQPSSPTPTPIVQLPGETATPSPKPSGSPKGSPSPSPGSDGAGDGELFGEIPPGFKVPVLPRTAARNTIKLVRILEEVTTYGVSLEEAMTKGMGRLPVGGLAWWSDDWWNPRFTPSFHLHEGLDIFADFGTPVRAPDAGVVIRITDGAVGGLAVWTRGTDGTQYYFAHLQEVAAGIEPGRPVGVGTVLGYVGDSGNARGGAPHLHFEVHKPHEVPPKPFVDAWLDEAEANAERWVQARIAEVVAERKLLRTEQSLAGVLAADRSRPGATPEYSILLALLDPVAGSVGMLPGVPLQSKGRAPLSEPLLIELIRLRVNGGIIQQLAGPSAGRTDP